MNAVNDLDTPTEQRECKAYATLAAQYAMLGYRLIKGDPAIAGQAPYYVAHRDAMIRALPDLDVAGECLARLLGHGCGKE